MNADLTKFTIGNILQLLQLAIMVVGGSMYMQKVIDEIRALGVRITVAERDTEKLETRLVRIENEKFGKA